MTDKYYDGLDLEQMIARFRRGYLTATGWLRSAEIKEAVDFEGPVPWYTYAAIDALKSIVRPEMKVFEYGGGGSTLWWSNRASEIISVDHDAAWVKQTLPKLRPSDHFETITENAQCDPKIANQMAPYFELNLPIKLTGDPGKDRRRGLLDKEFLAYAGFLLKYPQGAFDIVSVDGMARNLTAWVAARQVSDNGFIIFDNSDRDDYSAGYEILHQAGFARIDFTSPGPINPYAWTTSIWTKSLNLFRKWK
ncbi:MAG: hypothetical protein GXP04_00920 [Alphaproteobacteria bacterium]|nr:hypothetical protein [Alphaproteobacteria bacterium]